MSIDKKEQLKNDLNVSFANKQYEQSLKSYKHVLDEFKEGNPKALKLEGDTPIFLDTNVLLSVYEVSFIARENIKQFVIKQKDRIVLTSQVQHEYIKNREKVINTFQATVTEQIPKNFKAEVLNKFSSFFNTNKAKLEDYSEIQKKLQSLEETITNLHKEIEEKVNDKKDTAKTLLLDDDFLKVLSELKTTDSFEKKHIESIKDDYSKLLQIYKLTSVSKKDDSEAVPNKESYSLLVFPGCGEKADKDDPSGDFIIYHELMQYALTNKTDIIFLTNDTTKGDWLRRDGKTHIHYLENFYNNTGQLIYIINAERLFEGLFTNTSFESLVPKSGGTKVEITKSSLEEFLLTFDPFNISKYKNVTKNEWFLFYRRFK